MATTQIERLTAALADHYAIQQELGQGGMATVYLARDLKHDRLVAVKVLHPDLAASMGAERFLREIQITAKLSHPHILPLYDSGEAGGFLYYVMPFVEGESLASKLEREKQLGIEEALQITREVAEGLAHAHSYGLIHRDIKPDNIMLSGGHAVIADFGIARAVSEAGAEKMTQTGMAVGTPAYMSPEQGAGDPNLDGRSDIYSLGCVLYELLIGQIPFTGPTPQAIIARHSMDHITPPSIMRNTIPPELEDIINCAMAKVPADRFRTAQEFADALNAMATGGTPKVRRTTSMRRVVADGRPAWRRAAVPTGVGLVVVALLFAGWQLFGKRPGRTGGSVETLDAQRVAVLYFQDMSRSDTLGYLGDGLTEALIQRLSTVPQLKVLSQDAVAPYRNPDIPRDSIGHALNAGSLVTGSVEPAGDRVRVTVRLVDGFSGSDIESRTFELPSKNLLAVRDSAAQLVSGFLRRRLGEEVALRELRSGTSVVEAWTLVQRAERARKEGNALEGDHPDSSMALYRGADSLLARAEAADPKWPKPVILQGWLAYDESFLAHEAHETADRLKAAVAAADRALALEANNADALHLRGRSRYALWRLDFTSDPNERANLLDQAEADLDAAVKVDPNLANAWYILSVLQYDRKDNVDAAINAERAYEADAFLRYQDNNLYQLFQTHYDLEHFPNAQRWCDEGAKRFPDEARFAFCQLMMLITPWAKPNVGRAWALARRVDSLAPSDERQLSAREARMFVAGALARAGLPDSARHVLVAARAGQDIDPEQELAVREAVIRVILGDEDEAVNLWKRYVLAHPTHKIDLTRDLHWWWRPLRDNPGFQALFGEGRAH